MPRFSLEKQGNPRHGRESVTPKTKVHSVPTLSVVPVLDTGATGTTPTDVCRGWKSVSAIVMGNHGIPQRTVGPERHRRS